MLACQGQASLKARFPKAPIPILDDSPDLRENFSPYKWNRWRFHLYGDNRRRSLRKRALSFPKKPGSYGWFHLWRFSFSFQFFPMVLTNHYQIRLLCELAIIFHPIWQILYVVVDVHIMNFWITTDAFH